MHPETANVGAIILAAGASTRMGRPKQLLAFRGQSLLRRAVKTAIDSVCRPVVVVLGADAEQLRREVSDGAVHVVENRQWREGMSSSIRVGLDALAGSDVGVEAVVLMLCDQPLISSRSINALVEKFTTTRCPIVASVYGETRGVPALFERSFFPNLRALEGDDGARHVIKRHASVVCGVTAPEALFDVDTPEDYQRLHATREK